MSGFCSAHMYHDPNCHICESADISPAEREVLILAQGMAREQRPRHPLEKLFDSMRDMPPDIARITNERFRDFYEKF